MDIREMKAGKELDALIHFKVLKKTSAFTLAPRYSTDISAAWEVVEKMNCPYIIASTEDGDESWVYFGNEANAAIGEAPHAICIASLLALEDKA